MSLLEKNRMKNLLMSIQGYFDKDKSTPMKLDPKTATVKEFFKKYDLSDETRDFMIHAMALDTNNDCLDKPAYETF